MELHKISQLLDQYWKGELSEAEENALKQALLEQKPDLEGDLKEAAHWFKSAENYKDAIRPSADFDDKLMAKIKSQSKPKEKWSWWKVAAAVLIMFTLGYTAWKVPNVQPTQTVAENTADNPEKAFEETKATLALMASLMDNGKNQLESLELFQKAQEKIKNSQGGTKEKKNKNS